MSMRVKILCHTAKNGEEQNEIRAAVFFHTEEDAERTDCREADQKAISASLPQDYCP